MDHRGRPGRADPSLNRARAKIGAAIHRSDPFAQAFPPISSASLLTRFLIALAILIDALLVAFRALLAWLTISLVGAARLRLAFAFLVRLLLVRHG